jgi:predicted transposase YdaD
MPLSVHDALFKSTFSDPRHAAGALRCALPPAFAARVDWPTLALEPGSFVDDDLQDRHADLLFSARVADRRALLYLLHEHQSSAHPLMPFRLVAYLVRIWESWLKNNPGAKQLPAILPVVLHHGEGGWTAARSMEALYDLDEETLAAADEHLVRLRFVLDDLAPETDGALRNRAMSALGRLVLYCFRHAREPDALIGGLDAWVDLALEVQAAPNGMAALRAVWRYILLVHHEKPEAVLRQLTEAVHRERKLKESVMTAGEVLMQRGEQRGEERTLRRTLLRQLTARFGSLPAWVTTKLESASIAELDAWVDRVITAATLEDALAG